MKKFIICIVIAFTLLAACNDTTPLLSTQPDSPSPGALQTVSPELTEATPNATLTVTVEIPAQPINPIAHFSPGVQVEIEQINMIDSTSGWAIASINNTSDDHILHTTDGGITWEDVTPPESGISNSFKKTTAFFQDIATAWIIYDFDIYGSTGSSPVVWRTTDSGENWTASYPLAVSNMMEFFVPGFFTFVDESHGWLLVHAGAGMMHDWVYLFATVDGGQTWISLFEPTESSLWMSCSKTGMAFNSFTSGFISGDCMGVAPGAYFFQTQDGGSTWSAVTLPEPAQSSGIFTNMDYACGTHDPSFLDSRNGSVQLDCKDYIASTSQSWLFVTSDGGNNWSPIKLPAAGGQYQFIDALTGFYVAGNVYMTTNGGSTWRSMAAVTWSGQPDFANSNTGWVAAIRDTEVALVKTINAGAAWSIIEPVIAP